METGEGEKKGASMGALFAIRHSAKIELATLELRAQRYLQHASAVV